MQRACIELQIGLLARRCAGVLVGLVLATVDAASLTLAWRSPGHVRKSSVPRLISGPTLVGRGAIALPISEPGTLRWNDGTPLAAGSANEAMSVSGTGRGFRLTAPADPTPRKLTLFVSATNANGRLVARLSDNSASEYANLPVRKVGSRWSGAYTLTYRAASPGQTLSVEWIQARGVAAPGMTIPGVSIQGAALSLLP